MKSKRAKKPVLYWVTLVVMITGFVGVALSADANGLNTPNQQDTGVGSMSLSKEFVANSTSDTLCVVVSPLQDKSKP